MKPKQPPYNLATLETALKIAARIVTIHGDKYLPIFERVLLETETLRKQGKLKQLAATIACME
jgi:hypothetical protein